jgi:hypothetical protein
MIMRRSKEGYRCEQPPVETHDCLVTDHDSLVKPMGVEGGKNNQASNKIAYVLFGALTKNSGGDVGGHRVLEKASVILKSK